MKRVKKILSMLLCSVVIFGGSNLNLVKANAQTVNKDKVSNQQLNTRSAVDNVRWVTGIKFRLRNKVIPCYTMWWPLNLICTSDNRLMLDGCTNISKNYTFDDEYVLGCKQSGNTEIITRVRPLRNVDASCALDRLKDFFNKKTIKVGDIVFIQGVTRNDSVRFENKAQPGSSFASSIIRKETKNDYTQGYQSIDKLNYAFRVEDKGLYEVIFKHSL